ncbi:MAG: hypothetical protein Q8O46_00440, partial [bacterium]|nr:hypothetical protein [bacterium]
WNWLRITHGVKSPIFRHILIFSVLMLYSVNLIDGQKVTATQIQNSYPHHFTVFDRIGEMAAGMGYIHVAIPLNLSTMAYQLGLIRAYIRDLKIVVDPQNKDRASFLTSIREIANFFEGRVGR